MTNLRETIDQVRANAGIAPCIVLGNGINRFEDDGQQPIGAWAAIVEEAIQKFGGAKNKLQSVANMPHKSLTNLEFMDMLIGSGAQKREVIDWLKERLMNKAVVSPRTAKFLEVVKSLDCPVLTTNYDQFLELESLKAGGLMQPVKCSGVAFSPLLLSTFWGSSAEVGNGFSIWHLHGTVDSQTGKYASSLRLTHSDYFNLFRAIDDRLRKSGNLRAGTKPWKNTESWLDLFFQRPIVMVGLGLDSDEIVLRWLFMKRHKFYQRRNIKQPDFIQLVRTDDANPSKVAFVDLVGGQTLECRSYEDLYH